MIGSDEVLVVFAAGVAFVQVVGWFGPIAGAAIYYVALMEKELREPLVWEVTSLIVCASVGAHALTAGPFTQLYARAGERSAEARC